MDFGEHLAYQNVRLESAALLVGFSASPGPSLPCCDLGCLGLVSKNSGKKPRAKSSGSLPSSLIHELGKLNFSPEIYLRK